HGQAHLPDGADPPPLREEGVGRAEDHRPLLDHLHPPGAVLAGIAQAPLTAMDVHGKSVVVVGLGRSGVAAARLLLARGARVVGVDAAPREKVGPATIALEALGAELALGPHDPA